MFKVFTYLLREVHLHLSAILNQPMSAFKGVCLLLVLIFLAGCTTLPPKNPDNLCSIFREYPNWYTAAADSREQWGTPIQVMMSIMKYESDYRADVRPPRTWYLGFIPGPRPSSAYGYAQAQDFVWDDYMEQTGHSGADRDDFADSIDFIGWYTNKTRQINGVSLWSAGQQYLNYHDGWSGYRRGTWKKKTWLRRKAEQVNWQAKEYGAQLKSCESSLKKTGFWNWLFG